MSQTKEHSQETKDALSIFWMGRPKLWLRGRKLSPEHKAKLSEAKKGKPSWNKGLPMTWSPARMTGKTPWNKGKKGVQVSTRKGKKQPQVSGENHWAWKGGITPINRTIRNSLEYKLWRESVFKKDDFTCKFCGIRGGWLEADHVKRFADYPELRLDVNNGRTLCRPCHLTTFKVC